LGPPCKLNNAQLEPLLGENRWLVTYELVELPIILEESIEYTSNE
jgi:hypothetical protein